MSSAEQNLSLFAGSVVLSAGGPTRGPGRSEAREESVHPRFPGPPQPRDLLPDGCCCGSDLWSGSHDSVGERRPGSSHGS